MSIYRIGLRAIVEICLSQGAWLWVSCFRKGKEEARANLQDFKMFDEASRGLYGSLFLIWQMKASHLACVGAAILILIQGFETLSPQMVEYADSKALVHGDSMGSEPAPMPPRSETWDDVIYGNSGDISLALSTKAAIYEGIIAPSIANMPVTCQGTNCTWPTFPSLAVCGACAESQFTTSCDSSSGCRYSMQSGTSIHNKPGAVFEYLFRVVPSKQSWKSPGVAPKALISTFDIMSAANMPQGRKVQASQCELWFCLQSYNVTVTHGVVDRVVTMGWEKSGISSYGNGQSDEYVFLDIPPEMNASNDSRYWVPLDSLRALNTFIDQLLRGDASLIEGEMTYESDWIQAIEAASGDLPGWIAKLATSLTNNVQLTGAVREKGNSRYHGTASIPVYRVQVNWSWIAYPVILTVLAFIYLMETMWRTAHDQVCAWKADSLPMLFCRVARNIHAEVEGGMDMPEGLKGRVGRTEIELVPQDNGGWVFREPKQH
ncbi:hypothetical protein GGS20DRAFT_344398 [Poronia punctata]|nr:hypothetical protein GGS20DRAFT_344398 [Poronia punctata]